MSKITKYSGSVKMLGNSKWKDGQSTYSIIEIGDHVLQNIVCYDGLKNYLERALHQGKDINLWIAKEIIFGITIDGKDYVADRRWNSFGLFLNFLVGLALLPVFGLGLGILIPTYAYYNLTSLSSQVINSCKNPVIIKVGNY